MISKSKQIKGFMYNLKCAFSIAALLFPTIADNSVRANNNNRKRDVRFKTVEVSTVNPLPIQHVEEVQEKQDKKYDVEEITSFIQLTVDNFKIPGLAIAIVENNKIGYHKAFGVRNINTHDSLSTEHIFHFASVSKPFVATAIMQLVEQNKISLDDKLTKHLPYFKIDDERFKDITIKQMLNHTSGLGDVDNYEWGKPKYEENAPEEYVKSLIKEKLKFTPGSDMAYSNLAFDILGVVITKVSGVPIETYLKENIFRPLEMINSSFIYPEIPDTLRTTPHIWEGSVIASEVYPYNRVHAPSSTLNSNVLEMSNWAIANLHKGQFKNSRILKEETYDLLWTNSVDMQNKRPIGLSWFLGEYKGLNTVYHGGRDLGYCSFFIMLPDSNLSVIVASNYIACPVDLIATGVLDILFGEKPLPIKQQIGFRLIEIFRDKGINEATEFYEKISSDSIQSKYYILDESGFTDIAYIADQIGLYKESLFLLVFNTKVHPNSSNAHCELGQLHMKNKRYQEAKSSFKKAMEIDPVNKFAIKKLEELTCLEDK